MKNVLDLGAAAKRMSILSPAMAKKILDTYGIQPAFVTKRKVNKILPDTKYYYDADDIDRIVKEIKDEYFKNCK